MQNEQKLTIDLLKEVIMNLQKDAELANMPARNHSLRVQTVQTVLQKIDSYSIVENEEYLQLLKENEKLKADVENFQKKERLWLAEIQEKKQSLEKDIENNLEKLCEPKIAFSNRDIDDYTSENAKVLKASNGKVAE